MYGAAATEFRRAYEVRRISGEESCVYVIGKHGLSMAGARCVDGCDTEIAQFCVLLVGHFAQNRGLRFWANVTNM